MQVINERDRTRVGSALVVWDPATATISREEVGEVLRETLGSRFWHYSLNEMGTDAELARVIESARSESHNLVAVAGGNSAVRRVADLLVGTGVPLGILPVGSSNLLAREIGIPDDLFDAASILASEHSLVEVDAMKVGDRHFLLQIGVGAAWDDEDGDKQPDRKGFALMASVGSTMRVLAGRGGTRFTVVIDGKRRRMMARQIVVANTGGLGAARLRWAPGIRPTDSQVDLVALRVRGGLDYLRLAWRLLRRPHDNRPYVKCYAVREHAIIAPDEPLPVIAGGKAIQSTPLRVEVVPKAIRVIAPREDRQTVPVAVPVQTRVSRRPVPLRTALMQWLGPVGALDTAAFLAIHRLPHPPAVTRFMQAIEEVMAGGDGWMLGVALAKFGNLRALTRIMSDLAPALWLTSSTIEFPIKAVLRRPRPFRTLVLSAIVGRKPGSYSLPSGHSATAFAGAWLLRHHFPRWSPLLYVTATLVAFSRVYLGVHYLSDVIVGGAVGTGLAWLFRDLNRRLRGQFRSGVLSLPRPGSMVVSILLGILAGSLVRPKSRQVVDR